MKRWNWLIAIAVRHALCIVKDKTYQVKGRKKRIDELYDIGKLTDEEYADILGTEVDI